MKGRPLCLFLMVLLFVQCFRQVPVEVPAASIFRTQKEVKDVILHGQIYQKEIREKYQILYLKNNSITYQNHSYQESRIIVYDDSFQKMKIGQQIKVRGDGSAFEEARNPGNYDAKKSYAKRDIYGSLWASQILDVSGKEWLLQEKLFEIRQTWAGKIRTEMGEEKGNILCAILLNEKDDLDEDIKELYQKNGYGHILAISGLHISFIGVGIYHILRKIGAGYGVSALISMSILVLYVVMIGFSVSIFRAFLMLLIRIGAEVTGRVYDMLTAVFLSAGILVLYEPLYLADAAFQLSHGAILALLIVAPAIKRYENAESRLPKSLYGSLAIQISLLPITLWWYYEISPYSLLWNLIVIPLMSGLMTFGILGSFLPFPALWLKVCKLILSVFEAIGEMGSRLPGSRIVVGRPSMIAMILFYVWLVIMVFLSACKGRYRKGILISFFLVCSLFIKIPTGELEITMLDVGQGDCICLEGPYGKNYLIDGGSSDVSSVGKYRIESFLLYKGIGKLDYVFLSHGDQDHYSGVKELLQRQKVGVEIRNLVLPETYRSDEELLEIADLARENGIRVSCIKQGQVLKEHETTIRCIQPGSDDTDLEGNAGSMVLEIRYKAFSMLFTGDTELEGEERLIQNLSQSYQVLKVAHHGSKNATSKEFLERVNPKVALISAGENNMYGHPHEEVLDRLKAQGCRILCTFEQGAITLKTRGNSLTF